MRAEDAAAIARLRRHLALPAPLRAAHAFWLRRYDAAGANALSSLLALAGTPEVSRLDAPVHVSLMSDDTRQDDARLAVGDRLGAWRIEAPVGAGGMGDVFVAHRDDGAYRQRVAIKRLRASVASTLSTEAFLREREILARLDHPGICRLIDGGVDAQGRPWLAMELIDGEPIDAWCDRHRLTVRERVTLFLQACEAVHDAHRRGVLHGDIKPANLLVDTDGRARLVDFGVAALLKDTGDEAACIGLTEAYAAPERLAQEAKGFRSDVYALGAVLCRLVVGVAPASGATAMLFALLDPSETSTFRPRTLIDGTDEATLHARRLPHRRALATLVDGDLGVILSHCLHVCAETRYESAAALAEDLRRWLTSAPVSVASRTPTRRLRSLWSRRRRRFLLSIAAVIAVFGIGIGSSRYAAHEAQTQLAQLHLVLEDSLGPATALGLGDAALSPRVLLARAETRLRASQRISDGTPLAYGLLALSRSYVTLGDYPRALALIEEAHKHDKGDRTIRDRADAVRAAILNQQARYSEAEAVARAALSNRGPFDALFRDASATIWTRAELARAMWHRGRHRDAMAILDASIADTRKERDAQTSLLPELLTRRAQWKTDLYDTASAMRDLEDAVRLSDGLQPTLAHNARLAMVRALLRMQRQAEAQALALQTLTAFETTYGTEHPETGRALLACVEALLHTTKLKPEPSQMALAYSRRAMSILGRSLGEHHPLYTESLKYSAYTRALTEDPNEREIIAQARQSLALLRASSGATLEQQISAKIILADILSQFSIQPRDSAMFSEALALHAEIEAQTARAGIPIPHQLSLYARALHDGGRAKEATRVLRRANDEIIRYLGTEHPMLPFNHLLLAKIASNAGDDAAASRAIDHVLRATAPERNARIAWIPRFEALSLKAEILERAADAHGALALRREAIDYATTARGGGADHPRIRELQQLVRNAKSVAEAAAAGAHRTPESTTTRIASSNPRAKAAPLH